MRNRFIWPFAVIAIAVVTLSGCGVGGFKVEEKDFRPRYMCSGDDVYVMPKLNKEISRLTVDDATGTRLKSWEDRKEFELTVPAIRAEQLQLKVRLVKKFRFLRDVKMDFRSDFELFDDPAWSTGIETIACDADLDWTTWYWEEVEQDCWCAEYSEDYICRREVCADIALCYEKYDFYWTLRSLRWALPDYNYSSRIRVSGIKNLNDFPVTIDADTSSIEVSPHEEVTFPAVSYRQVSVSAPLPQPIRRYCGLEVYPRCCPGYICPGGEAQPVEGDYPTSAECFEDFEATVQLRLECEVPDE